MNACLARALGLIPNTAENVYTRIHISALPPPIEILIITHTNFTVTERLAQKPHFRNGEFLLGLYRIPQNYDYWYTANTIKVGFNTTIDTLVFSNVKHKGLFYQDIMLLWKNMFCWKLTYGTLIMWKNRLWNFAIQF